MNRTVDPAIPKPARCDHLNRTFRETIETVEASGRTVAYQRTIACLVQRGA
jgi:hypothetical protein